MIGRTLGHYRILEKLGEGGMGEVYRAHDTRLDRDVALKVLRSHLLEDPKTRQRFLAEARAAAALDHPNICAVHEIGQDDGTDFIAMELVRGESLKEHLQARQLALEQILEIAVPVADALSTAHAKGIIHRDVKSANIRLTERHQPKLLDFGLARRVPVAETSAGLPAPASVAETLSIPGTIVGTPAYMSPEQLRGEALDGRSDVFSFGAVLYEMVTGRLPFAAGTALEAAASILQKDVMPMASLRGEMPAELDRIVLKALVKDRDRRYQSMKDLLVDLENLRDSLAAPKRVRPLTLPERVRGWVAAKPVLAGGLATAAVFVVALLVAFLWLLYPRKTIAEFGARDWILVADIDNSTGDADLDRPLNNAISIDIQQSKYVNVFSRTRVRDTLKLMKRENVTKIDAATGLEICRREGIKAMLVPAIDRVGDAYTLSSVLVEVNRGTDLAPVRVTVRGKDAVLLTAVDDLTRQLRRSLGESFLAIRKDDRPISRATTASWEALQQYSRGVEQFDVFKTDEARAYLERAVQIDPNFAMAYSALGWLHRNWGDKEMMKQYYSRAFQLRDAVSDRERYNIEAAYYGNVTGELTKAAESYRILMELYPFIDQHNNLANLYLRLGRTEDAIAEYRQAIKRDPTSTFPYINLRDVYFQLDRPDEALALCRQQAQTMPNSPSGYHGMGLAYYKKGQLPQAAEFFQKALAVSPDYVFPQLQLGWLRRDQRKYDEAIRAFQAALKIAPEMRKDLRASAHVGMAQIYYDQNRLEPAVRELQAALEINPDSPDALSALGRVRARQGQAQKAMEAAERAVQYQMARVNSAPGNRNVGMNAGYSLYELATVHAMLGQRDQALRNLGKAIEEGYKIPRASLPDADWAAFAGDPEVAALFERLRARKGQ